MDKEQTDLLIESVAAALEIDKTKLNTTTRQSDIEEWDSLGHISILAKLDEVFSDISVRRPEISEADSIQRLMDIVGTDLNS